MSLLSVLRLLVSSLSSLLNGGCVQGFILSFHFSQELQAGGPNLTRTSGSGWQVYSVWPVVFEINSLNSQRIKLGDSSFKICFQVFLDGTGFGNAVPTFLGGTSP